MNYHAAHRRTDSVWSTLFPRRGRHRAPFTRPPRGATSIFVAMIVGLAVLVTGAQVGFADDDSGSAEVESTNVEPQEKEAAPDLRQGAVFVQSNAVDGNMVVAFYRNEDGTLKEAGRYPTGGTGSGSFEDSATAMVLGSANGEASPNSQVDERRLLFVANPGSSTISVFEVMADKLQLVEETPSGGQKPVSLTVANGLLYVLNSGETDNRLFIDEDLNVLENCTSGALPSVSGFRVSNDGHLTPIRGSKRVVSGQAKSGCAEVAFNPAGDTLVVSERLAKHPDQESSGVEDDEGTLTTFQVREDGTLGRKQIYDTTGRGPFGFTFLRDGTLIATEQNGGFLNKEASTVSSYTIESSGALTPVGDAVEVKQTDTCWIVVTEDQKHAYASSAFGGISSFNVGEDGQLELIHPVASAPDGENLKASNLTDGNTDLALSRDSQYLYQLNSFEGSVTVFKTSGDGSLEYIEKHPVFDLPKFGAGGEGSPMGLTAS